VTAIAAPSGRGMLGRRRRPEPREAPPRGAWASAGGESGVVLGRLLAGDRALPVAGGVAVLSPERACRHVVLLGASGSGKTETALAIAYALARYTPAQVFYLDGKGDRQTARRFAGLMRLAGRECRVFPHERFDGWRGDRVAVQNRLMEIVDYATEGPAAYYRDIAKTTLSLACHAGDGPPRSSGDLLGRLDRGFLSREHGGAAACLTVDQVRQVRMRYQAFFAGTGDLLDGSWSWADTPTGYLLLDSLALREEASSLARVLFEDFAQYFTQRKPQGQRCFLIVDEFSALAQTGQMASRVEQARGYQTGLILAPQTTAGMGGPEQAARILGSAETIICHRTSTPEDIVALAGTRLTAERSLAYSPDGPTGDGSIRVQHQYRVDPNDVRRPPTGQAWVIARGQAMKLAICPAPQVSDQLPDHDHDQDAQTATSTRPTGTVAVPAQEVPF